MFVGHGRIGGQRDRACVDQAGSIGHRTNDLFSTGHPLERVDSNARYDRDEGLFTIGTMSRLPRALVQSVEVLRR